jgi:hypothetical protein
VPGGIVTQVGFARIVIKVPTAGADRGEAGDPALGSVVVEDVFRVNADGIRGVAKANVGSKRGRLNVRNPIPPTGSEGG